MMITVNTELISYFKVAVKESGKKLSESELADLITLATQSGYIIHPDCWNNTVLSWLRTQKVNYNATFYNTWQEIVSKDRIQLFLEQIVSYALNYGLNQNFDMNNHDYSLVPDIRKYQVILPVTEEEMFVKCRDLIYTNIALKDATTEVLCDYIKKYYNLYHNLLDINMVSNKEALAKLCVGIGIFPKDPIGILRCMVYSATDSAMLIKDNRTLNVIKYNPSQVFNMSALSQENKRALASIFYRFKPIFLAFKHQSDGNATVVNKIRKLAKKYHKPMKVGFWESIISNPVDIDTLIVRLAEDKPTNFKLISLCQTINENLLLGALAKTDPKFKMYIIRNGSVFIKNYVDSDWSLAYMNWLQVLQKVLYDELVNRMRTKACTIKLPKELKLVCPTSEKSFVGNIPFGSYFDMTTHNMIGIYWREEWGTRDFDLSLLDYNGSKIGWNGDFYLNDVIYSGDMTTADPEASEIIYIKSNCPDGMIKVNRYSGEANSKYMFMVAQSAVSSLPKNYMVDPNTIKFQTEVTSKDKSEQIVGFISNNRLYICEFDSGNSRVSKACNQTQFMEIMKRRGESFIDLEMLLKDAEFNIVYDDTSDTPIDLDLSDLNKDTLINLFS